MTQLTPWNTSLWRRAVWKELPARSLVGTGEYLTGKSHATPLRKGSGKITRSTGQNERGGPGHIDLLPLCPLVPVTKAVGFDGTCRQATIAPTCMREDGHMSIKAVNATQHTATSPRGRGRKDIDEGSTFSTIKNTTKGGVVQELMFSPLVYMVPGLAGNVMGEGAVLRMTMEGGVAGTRRGFSLAVATGEGGKEAMLTRRHMQGKRGLLQLRVSMWNRVVKDRQWRSQRAGHLSRCSRCTMSTFRACLKDGERWEEGRETVGLPLTVVTSLVVTKEKR